MTGEMGVLAEALAQIARLAHIQHLFFTEHLINARAMADRSEKFGGQRRTAYQG